MRVTSNHIVDVANEAASRAQSAVAQASEVATSGLSVAVPSDDPVAWATAQREKIHQTISQGGGKAISTTLDQLQQTDGSLSSIADVISQARVLAVQGSSGTYTAAQRAALGTQVSGLFQDALSAANAQGSDGSYLLAGDKSTTPPFDANGVYQGDSSTRTIATTDSGALTASVSGLALTAANGVDILPQLQQLATALTANNLAGIQASLGTLSSATDQVSQARAIGGTAMSVLNDTDSARQSLETQLSGEILNLTQADAVTAASNLAQSTQALQITQAVSAHVLASLSTATTP